MDFLLLFAIAIICSLSCLKDAHHRPAPLVRKLPQEDVDFSKETGWQIPDLILFRSRKIIHPNYINEYYEAKKEWLAKRKSQ